MRITGCDRRLAINEVRAQGARQASAPGDLVRQAKRLVEKAEELLEQAVIAERDRSTSWEQIGQALGGQTKSAAHKRFASVVTEHFAHLDDVTYEDEASGEEIPIVHTFDVAYALLEETWDEAAHIVQSQDVLEGLRSATLAASGVRAPDNPSRVEAEWTGWESGVRRAELLHSLTEYLQAAFRMPDEEFSQGRVSLPRRTTLPRAFIDVVDFVRLDARRSDYTLPSETPERDDPAGRSVEERLTALERRLDALGH